MPEIRRFGAGAAKKAFVTGVTSPSVTRGLGLAGMQEEKQGDLTIRAEDARPEWHRSGRAEAL